MESFFQFQSYVEGDVQMEKIAIHRHLGRGNSDVYLASIGPKQIAIKQTQIQSDYQYHNFLKEVSMLKALSENSDAVIKYEGYFLTLPTHPLYAIKKYGYLLMQNAEMNLTELIKSNSTQKTKLSSLQLTKIVSTLLAGFSYLQNLNIAHCDIKPQNILVTNYKEATVKICDVGSCKTIQLEGQNEATIHGTLSFSAPELIKIKANKVTSINAFRSDVFSFGLVLLYLVTGKKFTSHERNQIKQQVYFQVIAEWIKQASQILGDQYQINEITKKALEMDQFKRPLFKQLRILYDSLNRKKKILKENRLRKIKKTTTETDNVEVKKAECISEGARLPKIKISNSSTLISFNSRQMLTGKISIKSSKPKLNKESSQKSKRSNDKSRSKASPLQKTTNYSTFSIDKSKISMQLGKKIIHVTSQNYQMIPYENLFQGESTFVLHCPFIQFESALAVVIKKQCGSEVFNKLSSVKWGTDLYVEYGGVQIYGIDENTPTVPNFTSVYINLENSFVQDGYNNLLRCLCPISLKDLHLQLTGSEISYKQVWMELERLKHKHISKLDISWDRAFLNEHEFAQFNQKVSRLPLKKLSLSLGSAFLKPSSKSRWPLPAGCKILYLSFPNNFLSPAVANFSTSLGSLSELKQLYLNMENNCLSDTDVKIIIKSLTSLDGLQKVILNFSWNSLTKGCYCLEELSHLNKVSSLELRLSKCGIAMEQFIEIFVSLVKLFSFNLKILKLTLDRKVGKNSLCAELEQLSLRYCETLKVDVIGYDYLHLMVYVKKKNPPRSIRIRVKQNAAKNSMNKITPTKAMDQASTSSKTIPYTSLHVAHRKRQQHQCQTTLNMKQPNHPPSQKTCSALFSTSPTYQCYICLGCIQEQETAKNEYFCRACIQNCHHKGHHIVRTYEKKLCACPYNHKCHFKSQNNDLICADRIGIQYKKQYECQKCHSNQSLCEGCILQCQEDHPEWVIKKPSAFFVCHTQAKASHIRQDQEGTGEVKDF